MFCINKMNHLEKVMGLVDDFKESIGDKNYLEITTNLQKVFDIYSSIYQITFVYVKFIHLEVNSYVAKPISDKKILVLSQEEITAIQDGLEETKNWLNLHPCNEVFARILKTMSVLENFEMIGVPDLENSDNDEILDVEISMKKSLVVTNLTKI